MICEDHLFNKQKRAKGELAKSLLMKKLEFYKM